MVVKAKRRRFKKVHLFESPSLILKAPPLAQERIPVRGGANYEAGLQFDPIPVAPLAILCYHIMQG